MEQKADDNGAGGDASAAKRQCGEGKQRLINVKLLGGDAFQVLLPADATVKDLGDTIREQPHVGSFFKLVKDDAILSDPHAPLPSADEVTCVVEASEIQRINDEIKLVDPCPLCEAAQRILKSCELKNPEADDEEMLKRKEALRLGTCRQLGKFPTKEWKEDPRMADFMEYHNYNFCTYHVLELTLIDGEDKQAKLIGVINSGDGDCNSGFWGSLYRRPGFEEIGGITSYGDTESKWQISDDSWYTAPEPSLRRNTSALCGGPESGTALEKHLSHALALAMNYDEEEEEDEDEEEEEEENAS